MKDNLVGRKFGKLTVLYESDVRGRSRNIHWVVQCDCDPKGERLKILPSGVLRGEYTRSCGCAAKNGEVVRSPEKRAKANANRIRRYAEDEKFVLHTRTKALIRQTLKNRKAYRAEYRFKNLGYSIDELEIRLKSTVPNGFTWKDFLEGNLHIDHIRPIASFDFKSSEDPSFKEAWALSNLQLLTPQENREKRAHLDWVR